MVRDTNSGKGYKHDTICNIQSTRGQDINVQVNNALLHQQRDRLKSVCLNWGISGTRVPIVTNQSVTVSQPPLHTALVIRYSLFYCFGRIWRKISARKRKVVLQPYRVKNVSRHVHFCCEIRTIFLAERQLQSRPTTIFHVGNLGGFVN